MAHHSLDVLDVAHVLGQRRHRATNDLERQLRQSQFLRQFVQHPVAVVARIDEPAVASRKNERLGRIRSRPVPVLLLLLFFPALLAPCLEFFRQLFGNRDLGETSLGFAPGTDFPLVGRLLDLDLAEFWIEATPPQPKQLTRPQSRSGNLWVVDNQSNLQEISLSFSLPATAVGNPTGSTYTVTYQFSATTTHVGTQFLVQGQSGTDFADAGTGSCTTNTDAYTYSAGDTCTVDVVFKPQHPGQRLGSVSLTSSGSAIATNAIYGTGTGPLVAFPGSTTLSTFASYSHPTAVTTDSTGGVYFAAVRFGLQSVMYSGGSLPVNVVSGGLAVDAFGNLFGTGPANNGIYEYPGLNNNDFEWVVPGYSSGLSSPHGLAVDAADNLYVADTGNNLVKEYLTEESYATAHILASSTTFTSPQGLALDASGNVYVSDLTGGGAVWKIPVASSTATSLVSTGLNNPAGLALDASGNIYVADKGNNAVKQIVAAGGYSVINTLASGTGYNSPDAVAVDGAGDVYVADYGNGKIVEIALGTAPSLSFAATDIGSTSSDSPLTVMLANIGNATLDFPAPGSGYNPSVGANFTLDTSSGTDCPQVSSGAGSPGTLGAGVTCNLHINFVPIAAGNISSSVVLTDTNLNATAATQTIQLSGTGNKATPSFHGLASPTITYGTAAQRSL